MAICMYKRRSTFYSLSDHVFCSDTTIFQRHMEENKPQDLGLLFVKNLFYLFLIFYYPWHFEIGFSKFSCSVRKQTLSVVEYAQNRMTSCYYFFLKVPLKIYIKTIIKIKPENIRREVHGNLKLSHLCIQWMQFV